MSRTIRRKHYIPRWVTGELMWRFEKRGYTELNDDVLKRQLHYWHEDKSCWWGTRPSKWFRQLEESTHRAQCRTELSNYWKDEDYEVMILSKRKLPYWD